MSRALQGCDAAGFGLQQTGTSMAAERIAGGGDCDLRPGEVAVRGHGPVVPGIAHDAAVGGQHDVDALLSDLGV
jgi:hypothetical protein